MFTFLPTTIFLAAFYTSGPIRHGGTREYLYEGSDYPQRWDILPLENVQITIENSVHFALDSPLGGLEWNSTLPSGGGFLYLGENLEQFSISTFHQLRCLDIVRQGLVKFRNEGRRRTPNALVHHCMNYLRQMILCRSDLRLEHGRHLLRGIAVSDVTHSTCKDWGPVFKAAEDNYRNYVQKLSGKKHV
ncbi:uncharacterized protein LACBIDRAFT_299713 [Laccaria bicolor S238N-H82]|uniref:Predicted protein n=1 Tax=Laccaria bicolor (strain S238N-H82 / ATCC MYA-4686) TaxID=486041 RepID=B0DF91_LACBS|nr:uncharacterized protein LACBIDRAFT_299713 [Laccaria bicolor S238N-H82]EDR06667.1 predicted protein [Laccaria bicolor S238N-H82]|eukprot:XP_001882514.1 predicted protein [Laccaria bicolor S238N-H82]